MQVDLSRPRFAKGARRGPKSGLTSDDLPELRRLLRTSLTLAEIGSHFGVGYGVVARFVKQRAICDLRARRGFYWLQSSIEKATEDKRDMTPTQAEIVSKHKTFLRKLAAQAKPDTGIQCASVSARVPAEPEPEPDPYEEIMRWRERQYLINPIIPSEPKRAKTGPKPKTPFEPTGIEPVSVRLIQNVVARTFGIGVMDLLSARRMKDIVRPRQIAMFLAKEMTTFSLPALGRQFGYRDHTTVLHAVRKMQRLRQTDSDVAAQLSILQADITRIHDERTAAMAMEASR